MNFEEALAAELGTISGITGKVYPGFSPGKTAPYIVYLSSEGIFDKTVTSGYILSKTVNGSLNVVAAKYDQLKTITKACIQKIISFEQRSIGSDGPYIEEFTYEQPIEIYEDEPKLYRCVIDFTAYFKESE